MIKVNLPNAIFAYSATIIQSPPTNWFHTQSGNETNAMCCSLTSYECPGSPADTLTVVRPGSSICGALCKIVIRGGSPLT